MNVWMSSQKSRPSRSLTPVDGLTMPRNSRNSSSLGSLGVPAWSINTSNRVWPGSLKSNLPSGP